MFIKVGKSSLRKDNENVCGDNILIKRYIERDKIIAVLSDGLGSGIKADILSLMTSTMLLKFAENGADLIKAAEIVMNSLPVCKIRNTSYSTFSVVTADSSGNISVIEEGNPDFIYIKDGQFVEIKSDIIKSKTFNERNLKIYNFNLDKTGVLIFMSDGVTEAGRGLEQFRGGIGREKIKKAILDYTYKNKNFSPDNLAEYITSLASYISLNHKPQDDISALVLKAEEPVRSLLFTGPPYNLEKDSRWAKIFNDFKGKKAISGGTTANILSRELKKELVLNTNSSGNLPCVSYMDGTDLVVEGILTLSKTLEYLESGKFNDKNDAARDLADFLLSSDYIDIMTGARVNSAHYDPEMPVEIELRKDVVKKIAKILKEKYLKKVTVQYM